MGLGRVAGFRHGEGRGLVGMDGCETRRDTLEGREVRIEATGCCLVPSEQCRFFRPKPSSIRYLSGTSFSLNSRRPAIRPTARCQAGFQQLQRKSPSHRSQYMSKVSVLVLRVRSVRSILSPKSQSMELIPSFLWSAFACFLACFPAVFFRAQSNAYSGSMLFKARLMFCGIWMRSYRGRSLRLRLSCSLV